MNLPYCPSYDGLATIPFRAHLRGHPSKGADQRQVGRVRMKLGRPKVTEFSSQVSRYDHCRTHTQYQDTSLLYQDRHTVPGHTTADTHSTRTHHCCTRTDTQYQDTPLLTHTAPGHITAISGHITADTHSTRTHHC